MQAFASITSLKLFSLSSLITPFCKIQWAHLSHILFEFSASFDTVNIPSSSNVLFFFTISYLTAFPSISLLCSILHFITSFKVLVSINALLLVLLYTYALGDFIYS